MNRSVNENTLVGNVLCLDFTNTVNKRPQPDHDHLDSVVSLTRWATAAGIAMLAPRVRPGRDAVESLAAAVSLREAVYRVFSAVARGAEPPDVDVALVLDTYGQALASARLRRDNSRYELSWAPPCTVRQLTWRVATSAVRLLLEGPLDRVGECPSCHWLFLDTSRNGKRRWCDMAVCGSRAKSQRYYASLNGR